MPTTPTQWATLNRINYFADRLERAWRKLRSMRSSPPGAAASGDRRNVFCAALEQAEGLLEAAKTVDNAVRTLPLFYGLSQASRAVAASALALAEHEWRLTSHARRSAATARDRS